MALEREGRDVFRKIQFTKPGTNNTSDDGDDDDDTHWGHFLLFSFPLLFFGQPTGVERELNKNNSTFLIRCITKKLKN